ncbi:MAG: ABC transporter permease [Acidobacteriota bacterium]
MSRVSLRRIRGLAVKDAAELRRNPGAVVPAVSIALASLVPPFLIAITAPRIAGESLVESREFERGMAVAVSLLPELATLKGNALAQAFLFHQFGWLLLVVPVVGSMALASHAVIGEKTARTLEPLLATPITTVELLLAKTLTPLVLALTLGWTTLAVYIAGIRLLGEPDVWLTFLGARTGWLFLIIGPLLTLCALLLAVLISSRVNDPRTAQQLGVLVVVPVTGIFVAQLLGQFMLGQGVLSAATLVLIVLNAVLLAIGVRVFDREHILMRWK